LVLLVFLTSCASVPEKQEEKYQLARMLHLQNQSDWSFEGRLALTDEKDSVTANISWKHRVAADLIELSGPLAQGKIAISITADKVVLDDGETPKEFDGSADLVFSSQLGVDVPIAALRFWVLGVSEPGQPFVERTDGFEQYGWQIKYNSLQQVNTEWMPKKIQAEKDKTKIKLIVDQWILL